MNDRSIELDRATLKSTLQAEGPRAALAFLNSLTDQRFSSLYRFDGDQLRSMSFFDRESPSKLNGDDIPVLASYCVFVKESRTVFRVWDSLSDPRVADHPKQRLVRSYCGVPLRDREGNMFGTACHFDFAPGAISDRDVELLEYLGTLLQPTLGSPPESPEA